MSNRSEQLTKNLRSVFTSHPTAVHEAAEAAEARLVELEERDRHRERRRADTEARLADRRQGR